MKEQTKDLIILCISTLGITFTHIWPAIFSYYSSYCFWNNPNIKVNDIYASFFFFLLGQLTGSIISPYAFFLFGTYLMYILFAIIELCIGFFSYAHYSFFAVSIVMTFKGLLF